MVKKQRIGQYVVYNYEADSADLTDTLSRTLRIMDSVLKFQTHRAGVPSRKVKKRRSVGEGTQVENLDRADAANEGASV